MQDTKSLEQHYDEALVAALETRSLEQEQLLCTETIALAGVKGEDLTEEEHKLIDTIVQGNKNPALARITAVTNDAVAIEGFVDALNKVAQTALASGIDNSKDLLLAGSTAIDNYCSMASKAMIKLKSLRELLNKNNLPPAVNTFSMGAYSRFLQCEGKDLDSYDKFAQVLFSQFKVQDYDYGVSTPSSIALAERFAKDSKFFFDPDKGESVREQMRQSVANNWQRCWKGANIAPFKGSVPSDFSQNHQGTYSYPVAALPDSRQLVVCAPPKGPQPHNVSSYMAKVVFDKKIAIKPVGEFATPTSKSLLKAVDEMIVVLHNFESYRELASVCKTTAKSIEKLNKEFVQNLRVVGNADKTQAAIEYAHITIATANNVVSPHLELAWMTLRSAMVLTALAETILFEKQEQRPVANKLSSEKEPEAPSIDSQRSKIAAVIAKIMSVLHRR